MLDTVVFVSVKSRQHKADTKSPEISQFLLSLIMKQQDPLAILYLYVLSIFLVLNLIRGGIRKS